MKLVDTSVAIDHLEGNALARLLLLEFVWAGEPLVASELTRFELLASPSPSRGDPERLFRALTFVPVNEEIARCAAELRAADDGRQPLTVGDYVIAATSLVLGADLLTTAVHRYPMLPGLAPPY